MDIADLSLACAWALSTSSSRGGVRHACLSPGSRSTPLALALSRHPDVDLHVHLDERSSAFFATGIADAAGRPGRARVHERHGRRGVPARRSSRRRSRACPSLVLTADRPPRLRGTGANQTIDQVGLYGSYAREYARPAGARGRRGRKPWWRQVGA